VQTFSKIVEHISHHGEFYFQHLDLYLPLDQGVHHHNILTNTLVFIFMEFRGY
jgi:hypothetical protein